MSLNFGNIPIFIEKPKIILMDDNKLITVYCDQLQKNVRESSFTGLQNTTKHIIFRELTFTAHILNTDNEHIKSLPENKQYYFEDDLSGYNLTVMSKSQNIKETYVLQDLHHYTTVYVIECIMNFLGVSIPKCNKP